VTAATPETPILGLLFYRLLGGEQGEQLERMAQSDGNAQRRREGHHLAERELRQAVFDKSYRQGSKT
jgi:hypothetical protein